MELLINASFWLGVAGLVVLASSGTASVKRVFRTRLVVAALAAGALANLGAALYLGYVAPRDMMQDVVSAQQFLKGKPLYPFPMTALIRKALEDEPASLSLARWFPGIKAREQRAYRQVIASHWVQAHPPTMTLATVPFVAVFGIHGTFLVLSFLSLLALGLIAAMLRRGPLSNAGPRDVAIAVLFAAGWFAVSDMLRLGQSGLFLSALLVAGWYLLREGRPIVAGVAVGVATCLKLFPGLVLIYLLIRHRKAGVAGVTTAAVLGLATIACIGPANCRDYLATSRFVVQEYRAYAENLSLYAPFAIAERWRWLPAGSASVGFLLAAVVVVAWSMRRPKGSGQLAGRVDLDLEYSRVLSVIPLVTPICWAHYMVILMLPLAVMGRRVLDGRASRAMSCAFAAALAALFFPESAVMDGWTLLTQTFHGALGMGTALLWRSAPTLALLSLFWLIDRAYRSREGVAEPATVQALAAYDTVENG